MASASRLEHRRPTEVDAEVRERRELEASIARHRGELRVALADLKRSALGAVAPSERIARRPYPWLAAAAALGFFLARRGPRRGA
jgi:hypothetical protein